MSASLDRSIDTSPKPEAALATLAAAFGFVPNLARDMAHSPAALDGYVAGLGALNGATGLSPVELQLAMLAASRANAAPYGVAVHATLAAKLGAEPAAIAAAKAGTAPASARLAAVLAVATALTERRWADAQRLAVAAELGDAALVEAAFAVALKQFANAIAQVAAPAIDPGFAG
jgi:AhpD family alkylhydroperoxidase